MEQILHLPKETYIVIILDDLHFEMATGDDVFLLHSLKKDSSSKIMWLESKDSIVSTLQSPSLGLYLRQRRRWISKWNSYNDRYTILTGILTFTATLIQLACLAALIFNHSFLWIFLAILLLKSIPDYLILLNTTTRYGKKQLMRWFLPAQLVYPLYVMGVVLYSLIPVRNKGD